MVGPLAQADMVALRKESVDRNTRLAPASRILAVALRKESVDRNLGSEQFYPDLLCRSPQGERG